jgi:hypothetical protein
MKTPLVRDKLTIRLPPKLHRITCPKNLTTSSLLALTFCVGAVAARLLLVPLARLPGMARWAECCD